VQATGKSGVFFATSILLAAFLNGRRIEIDFILSVGAIHLAEMPEFPPFAEKQKHEACLLVS
jgi:hypothetical protein